MEKYYTDEKNAQIVIALLKKHGINQIIASPLVSLLKTKLSLYIINHFFYIT